MGGSNHLFGYVIRLEQAFYDLANAYYATQLKRLKARKDSLSKVSDRRKGLGWECDELGCLASVLHLLIKRYS